MQNIILKYISKAVAVLSLSVPLLTSADVAATPALFGDALEQFKAKINLPETFAGGFKTLAVYCQTDVSTAGALENTHCYQHPKIGALEEQTLAVLKDIHFQPATIDGQAVPVRMQFRVVYSRAGDQPDIMLLPNLGTLQQEYGLDYVAPQERLDQSHWYQQYLTNDWAKGKVFFNEGRLTRVMGVVATSGKVSDVSTLDARGSGKRDALFVENALKETQFIPGFVNNKAQEMHYVAVLNYADGK